MHNAGVLFAARSERVLTEHGSMIAQLRAAGYRGAITSYDRTALLRLEPTLNQSVVGGFHAEDERHVRVETLINGLVANLRSQGTELLEHTVVTALARERARWRLRTATGAIHADTVVVAAGVGSRVLLQSLPYRIALEGAKGYSLTYRHSIDVPRHAIYLAEGKATISPFNDGVRITGLLEIPVQSRSVGQRQIATITDVANSYLRRPVPTSSAASWSGIRPLLPNCLPLIGPVPGAEHLYVATGHGILGVTLAPATAASLTALIINRRVGPELLPFLPLGGQLPSPTVEFETDETDDFTGPRHR
jgi:D-amino-acid dehydrogenase